MSWGERSCTKSFTGDGCIYCTEENCNVDCAHYEWDGTTPPDSETIRSRRRARGSQNAPKPAPKPLTKNQLKKRRQKARRK